MSLDTNAAPRSGMLATTHSQKLDARFSRYAVGENRYRRARRMLRLESQSTVCRGAGKRFRTPIAPSRGLRPKQLALSVSLSAVVPVGPNDQTWRDLITDLTALTSRDEVIFSAAEPEPHDLPAIIEGIRLACGVTWLHGSAGRAAQMNRGARVARASYLWFLHCDSRLASDAVEALRRSIASAPDALHYFQLRFGGPRPRLMVCNEYGVAVRSRLLGKPFGDQALCLDANRFVELGTYDEQAEYGEDHLLVLAARRQKLRLRCTGATIVTSSRKYLRQGWAATTLRHGWLTWKQAASEAFSGGRLRR